MVVVKPDGVGELDGHRPDSGFQPEGFKPLHDILVEVGNRAWSQRQGFHSAVTHRDDQAVVDKIVVDLEAAPALMGDRRGRQPAARHVERNLPPMVHQRRLAEPDLADDLGPQVERRARILPLVEWKFGPVFRSRHSRLLPSVTGPRPGAPRCRGRARPVQVTSTRTTSASSIAVTLSTRSFSIAAPSRPARRTPLTSIVPKAATR